MKLNVDNKNRTIHDRHIFLGTEDTRPDEDNYRRCLLTKILNAYCTLLL